MHTETTRLFVARHGETEDNAAGRWQGWSDSPLSPLGLAQAQALARRLAGEPLAVVYSSDSGRALHTARIAAAPHGLTPIPLAALRERDVGLFSGLTGPEVEARYPEALARRRGDGTLDWAPPEGESFRRMLARMLPALDAIAREWRGRGVLVVTHGGVIRLLAAHADGDDWTRVYERHPSNCGLSRFLWAAGRPPVMECFDEHGFQPSALGTPPLSEDSHQPPALSDQPLSEGELAGRGGDTRDEQELTADG